MNTSHALTHMASASCKSPVGFLKPATNVVRVIPGPKSQREELALCENVIEHGLGTFFSVAEALVTIQEKKLYRFGYDTFKEYCEQRWDITRSYAYRLLKAAEVRNAL